MILLEKENSFSRKKKLVKIKILQMNLQFDDFFRENDEFYFYRVAYICGRKNFSSKRRVYTYLFQNQNIIFFIFTKKNVLSHFAAKLSNTFHRA